MQSLKTLSREVPASACSLGCLRFCPDALHYYSAGPSIYPVDSTFHCPAAGGVGLKAAGHAPPLLPPGSNELGFYCLLVLGCVVSALPAGCPFTGLVYAAVESQESRPDAEAQQAILLL